MGIIEKASLPFQIKYLRCYLAPRRQDNTYDGWIDVSRYVLTSNLGRFRTGIDTDDFDIGFFEESNVTVAFDNSEALFTEGFGYFDYHFLDRSKIQLIAGYYDPENPSDTDGIDFEVAFEGILNDQNTTIDAARHTATFRAYTYSSIMLNLKTDPSAVTNGQSFQTAFYNLLNRSEVTSLMTLDLANINPAVN